MLNSQIKICCENIDLKSLVSIESARVFDHCSIRTPEVKIKGEKELDCMIFNIDMILIWAFQTFLVALKGYTARIVQYQLSAINVLEFRSDCFLFSWRAYERERRSARLSKIAHRAPKFWGTRGNQPSKVQWRPKPGNTAFVITVVPVPCKYGDCALCDAFSTLANAPVLWDFTQNHIILQKVFNFTQAANEHDCFALAQHEKGVRMSSVGFVSVEE